MTIQTKCEWISGKEQLNRSYYLFPDMLMCVSTYRHIKEKFTKQCYLTRQVFLFRLLFLCRRTENVMR